KDEFESNFSREVPFECWADGDLATLGFTNVNSATFFRTRATSSGSGLCIAGSDILTCNNDSSTTCTPQNAAVVCPSGGVCINTFCRTDSDCGTGGVCGPATGILGIVEEFHSTARTLTDASLVGSAAANTHMVDASDLLPPGPRAVGNGALERAG